MAYIEKRTHSTGKITYRARIRINGMPETCASFPTRTAAKEWAHRKESELKTSRYFPHEAGKYKTFASFVDLYIQRDLPKNPKAFSKQQQLMLWWKSKLGKYYLNHISPSLIASCRDELLAEATCRGSIRSPSTVNRYLAALSKCFTTCIREYGLLKENPTLFISRPPESKARERFLSLDEINHLLDACRYSRSPHIFPVVVFALATGARRGEILNLKWEDLHQEQATFRDTKNGDSRTITLTPFLLAILTREKKRRITLSPYIFPSLDGSQPADITSAWHEATKKASLPNLRFHDLRHTTASHLAMNGASTLEIAAILGHKTLAMVKRYSHFSNSATAKTLQRMNDVIFGNVG